MPNLGTISGKASSAVREALTCTNALSFPVIPHRKTNVRPVVVDSDFFGVSNSTQPSSQATLALERSFNYLLFFML
jgi:hypothetical protein